MFNFKDTPDFELAPKPAPNWQSASPVIKDEENKKKLFGVELNKNSAFEAACVVFPEDTNLALWVSVNWINDPIVIGAKDKYLETVDKSTQLLDVDQFRAKLLKMADEKHPSGGFPLLEGKDRVALLKLYAEVSKFTTDQNSAPPNFIYNTMTIRLVEPNQKEPEIKTIDNNEFQNPNSPVKIKLVG